MLFLSIMLKWKLKLLSSLFFVIYSQQCLGIVCSQAFAVTKQQYLISKFFHKVESRDVLPLSLRQFIREVSRGSQNYLILGLPKVDVWFESYNYFDKEGSDTWETDLEIYVSKTVPFYGINLKPELGFEGYDMMTDGNEDVSVYAQLRVDKSFDVLEGFVVTPYAAYTDYDAIVDGSTNDIYTEFGVETTYKF